MPPSSGGPQGGVDPWTKQPGGTPDPAPAPVVPDIDDIDPDDPNDPNNRGSLRDPFASPRGGGGGLGSLGGTRSMAMMTAMFHKACDRLATCGTADPTMKSMCQTLQQSFPNQPAPTCGAAQRCLATIDALSCSDDLDSTTIMGMMTSVQDCMSAMRC